MHDAKTGCAQGRAREETLFLVEWEGWPDAIGWTWELYEHFCGHAALADNFIKDWKDWKKRWPPQRWPLPSSSVDIWKPSSLATLSFWAIWALHIGNPANGTRRVAEARTDLHRRW